MSKETVKLLSGDLVKGLLLKAQTLKKTISVQEDGGFLVRDTKTNDVIFRGIKIRSDLWGITFSMNASKLLDLSS